MRVTKDGSDFCGLDKEDFLSYIHMTGDSKVSHKCYGAFVIEACCETTRDRPGFALIDSSLGLLTPL